ncbi:MAG: hypothetical protein IIB23_00815 [Chloroflexi bacterium]|nr:hypothetical protein [Chloroflexota bacterium]
MMRMTLLAAAAVAIAVTAAVFSSDRTEAHGQQVQLLWMSSLGRDVSGDLKYCTGEFNPPYHGYTGNFIDVMVGWDEDTLCFAGSVQTAKLRVWGFSATSHWTILAISGTGTTPSNCNYVQLSMVDAQGLLRGNARFTHTTGASGVWRLINAGPAPYGAVIDIAIGNTVNDPTACGNMHHVHQGFTMTCPDTNGGLVAQEKYFVWSLSGWVHQMNYREGHAGC